jgi:hypothetical protein
VFTEVFLVQIHRKLRKIHSEVHIQGKKTSGGEKRNFNIKGKKGNSRGEKEVWRVGRESVVPLGADFSIIKASLLNKSSQLVISLPSISLYAISLLLTNRLFSFILHICLHSCFCY